MTTPTQAQVEAAELREWIYEAINELSDPCDACDYDGSEEKALVATINNAIGKLRTALTAAAEVEKNETLLEGMCKNVEQEMAMQPAAAEVGEPKDKCPVCGETVTIIAATIERCMQAVNDWFTVAPRYRTKKNLLAAISALKDKP